MENLLQSIVLGHKETQKKLDEQTDVLNKILDVEKSVAKAEAKRDKRETQASKRRKADEAGDGLLGKMLGKEKKKGKGLLGTILGTVGKLLAGLGGLGIIKALGLGAIGAAVTAYFTSPEFRKSINNALGGLKDAMGDFFFGKDGVFNKKQREALGNAIGDFFTKDAPWKKNIREGTKKFFIEDAPWKENIRKGFMNLVDMITKPVKDAMAKLDRAIQDFGTGTVDFFTRNKTSMDTKDTKTALTAAKVKQQNATFAGTTDAEADLDVEKLSLLKERQSQRDNMESQKMRYLQAIRDAEAEGPNLDSTQRIKNAQKKLEDVEKNLAIKYAQLAEQKEYFKTQHGIHVRTGLADTFYNPDNGRFDPNAPRFFQSGGFVGTVPGQGGDGDRFSTMVAPGSVVLNQTAAGHFQNGGQVPVMLEQGEKVFGPRDPAAGAALMMNSMIGRFQTGGLVEASHSDTGSGWSVGKDYQGRPSIFTKEAAQSFIAMTKASNGLVKAADIASSTRSPQKNTAVGGVPGSNHLYGNAVDIHGASKVWMQQNGMSHGWKNLVYSGHDGHFDYMKGGAKLVPGDGDEKTARNYMSGPFAGMGPMGIGGKLGELIGGMAGAIQEVFGDLLGDMFGGLTGGASGSLSGAGGKSEPLTGDAASSAKKMNDYVISLGYSAAQAKGIVANIQRESNFDPTVRSGDDGGPGGLFQWKGDRQTPEVAQLVNSGDWKGQIRYALNEDAGPRYKSETAGMSAQGAADWWMKEWERPADPAAGSRKHAQFLSSYGFQNGGVANVRGTGSYSSAMVSKSQEVFAQKIADAVGGPTIIPVPTGGGGGGGGSSAQPGNNTNMPMLQSNDSSVMAMEYKYRITMGASI